MRERARAAIEAAKRSLDPPEFSDADRMVLGLIADALVERYS
ncbi:hypothetical protein BH20ACT15_BH20ACT15_10110 [soil metagenome]